MCLLGRVWGEKKVMLHRVNELLNTQIERYCPYTAVYGYFTDRITAVISGAEIQTVNDVVLIDLGCIRKGF